MKMTAALWAEMSYFKASEFVAPAKMEYGLIKRLDVARGVAAHPFVITSSWRSAAHNAAVGGEPNSAHLTGEGVDITAITSRARFHILRGLYAAGFKRLGVYRTHIHADVQTDAAGEVTWYA